jgi:hypothetical protein
LNTTGCSLRSDAVLHNGNAAYIAYEPPLDRRSSVTQLEGSVLLYIYASAGTWDPALTRAQLRTYKYTDGTTHAASTSALAPATFVGLIELAGTAELPAGGTASYLVTIQAQAYIRTARFQWLTNGV